MTSTAPRLASGPVCPKPEVVGVDDARVARAHVCVAEAEAGHRAGREVLGDDVGAARRAQAQLAALRVLEVDLRAVLAAVDADRSTG